jgi:hypothetical protein
MGEYVSSYHDIYKYDFSVLSHFTQIIVATSSDGIFLLSIVVGSIL